MKAQVLTVLGEYVEGDLALQSAAAVLLKTPDETIFLPMSSVIFLRREPDTLSKAEQMAVRIFQPLLKPSAPKVSFDKMNVVFKCLLTLTGNDHDLTAKLMYMFTSKSPNRFPTTRRLAHAPKLRPEHVYDLKNVTARTQVYMLRPPDTGCPLGYWFEAIEDLRKRSDDEKYNAAIVTMLGVQVVIDDQITSVDVFYKPHEDRMYAIEPVAKKVFLFEI